MIFCLIVQNTNIYCLNDGFARVSIVGKILPD